MYKGLSRVWCLGLWFDLVSNGLGKVESEVGQGFSDLGHEIGFRILSDIGPSRPNLE